MFGKSGKQELKVYQSLQEHSKNHSPFPGMKHFIPEWSTGSWSLGEYLELPCLISVGREMMKRKSCMDRQALLLCKQLLDGINFLHSRLEVAHMDIKPDNLVLDVSHDVLTLKIIDFNLSIMHADRMVVGVRGTYGYMAPEVKECSWYLPFLADRYSCGVCLEMFLERGRNVENCRSCYKALAAFAVKLRSRSPSKRPLLIECVKLHSHPLWDCYVKDV